MSAENEPEIKLSPEEIFNQDRLVSLVHPISDHPAESTKRLVAQYLRNPRIALPLATGPILDQFTRNVIFYSRSKLVSGLVEPDSYMLGVHTARFFLNEFYNDAHEPRPDVKYAHQVKAQNVLSLLEEKSRYAIAFPRIKAQIQGLEAYNPSPRVSEIDGFVDTILLINTAQISANNQDNLLRLISQERNNPGNQAS